MCAELDEDNQLDLAEYRRMKGSASNKRTAGEARLDPEDAEFPESRCGKGVHFLESPGLPVYSCDQ